MGRGSSSTLAAFRDRSGWRTSRRTPPRWASPSSVPPVPVSSFIAAPIRHRGESVGNIHVAKSEPGLEFSAEDEETLVMFASQAALVIANARRHRDELRARADLEALIDTSPVGVVVFDARAGERCSRSTARRQESSKGCVTPGRPIEQLLEVLSIRRADGREVSLQELTMLQALSAAETIRSEEVVFRGSPDGRRVTVLMNATPIRSEEGETGVGGRHHAGHDGRLRRWSGCGLSFWEW